MAHDSPVTLYFQQACSELSAKKAELSALQQTSLLVRTDSSHLPKGDEKLPFKPGMLAEVDVLSGKRSVLNYLLRPLIKARLN